MDHADSDRRDEAVAKAVEAVRRRDVGEPFAGLAQAKGGVLLQ